MDRHLFDILWEVYRDVDARKPIQIISSYRSPSTNAMLRRRSSGVARHSQHMLGHAMDFFIPEVPLEQIRFAGLRLQRGGVGFYPTSGSPFVHLDTGSIRHWPRMTHDQLVRVFPEGRTVHVPSDGVPLKGYELARADIEKRGNGDAAAPSARSQACSRRCSGGKATTRMTRAPALLSSDKPAPPAWRLAKSADPVPMPRAKPRSAPPSSLPRPTPRSSRRPRPSRPRRTRAQASADRAKAANAGRHHQCPRLLGRHSGGAEAGDPGADRSLRPAGRSPPPPIRSRPQASAALTMRWPTRRPPPRRSTAPMSSPPRHRSRRIPSRPRAMPAPATEINTVAAKGAQGQDTGRDLGQDRRRQGQRHLDAVMMLAPSVSSRCR